MTIVTPGVGSSSSDPPAAVDESAPADNAEADPKPDTLEVIDGPDAPPVVEGSGDGQAVDAPAPPELVEAPAPPEAVGSRAAPDAVEAPAPPEAVGAPQVADARHPLEAGDGLEPAEGAEAQAVPETVQRRRRESVVRLGPAALPLPPEAPKRRRSWPGAVMTGAVASVPMVMLLVSVITGGGPRTVSDDEALITLAARDVLRGRQLLGPYSRFGWHHPGPTYFFLLAIPTWIWHGGTTGPWVGAAAIGVVSVLSAALIARRYAGRRAGWWVAIGALTVVTGLGVARLRDPWNPYAVTLPLLFVAIAAVLAASGARGIMPWGLVVGSFLVQTDVSSGPIVLGLLGLAAIAMLLRRVGRAGGAAEPIPPELPSTDLPAPHRPWWRRPGLILAVILLAAEWSLPLWDEFFGTGNLTKIFNFFTSGHVGQSWSSSWRLTTAMFGITMFQHHQAIADTVGDPHPLATTIGFVGLCAFAIIGGVARRRPVATWFGGVGLLAGVLAVYSVTRVTGTPYHYLIVWMVVLPVVPLIGGALACEGLWCGFDLRWAAPGQPLALARPGPVLTAAAAAAVLVVAVRGAADAVPASRLSDPDIAAAWQAIAPIVGGGHGAVRIELADGGRWPAAAGIALELEQHGHPARVDPQWAFMFGQDRRVRGDEEADLVIATDQTAWPLPNSAVLLGQIGPEVLFVRREGTACSFAGLPFGGPACPVPAVLSGPSVPAPLGSPPVTIPAGAHPGAPPGPLPTNPTTSKPAAPLLAAPLQAAAPPARP